jgi:hypothetical protein
MQEQPTFRKELSDLLNKHSKENGSDTPDYLLADFVGEMIQVFDNAVRLRDKWHGFKTFDYTKSALNTEA